MIEEIVAKRGMVRYSVYRDTEDIHIVYRSLRHDRLYQSMEDGVEHIIRGPYGGPYQIDKDRFLESPPTAYTDEDLLYFFRIGKETEFALDLLGIVDDETEEGSEK